MKTDRLDEARAARLDEARAAVERGDWQRALDSLADLGAAANSAEGVELRARAAYGNGQLEACVSAWEELHALHVADGAAAEAARAAAMIAMYLMMDTGLMAPVRGWLRQADRLLDDHTEVGAHALIAMVRTYERFMCGDLETAREQAALAIELGDRLGVRPATVIGRVATARIMILEGQLDEGLDRLDEIGALLMSGQVDPLTAGMMYCELICAAQGLALHDRAAEWTLVMDRWRRGTAFGGINGRCRVHRAEMLRMTGPCDVAEQEALGACDELRPWMRREFGWPLAELGNIRLRRGDLEGAEEAFLAAHEHAWSPHPGLALVRLARGDLGSASALIADAIAHPLQIPSKERPPFGDLCLAPLLDAQVEIATAAGDLDTARRATDSLRSIAGSYPRSPALGAAASLAEGRTSLLSGDVEQAVAACGLAIAAWSEIGAPYEAAVARMVLGEAHHRSGNPEAARTEWRTAHAAFDGFGAVRWAARAAALADGRAPTLPRPAGVEKTATFRAEAGTRTIRFARRSVAVRDLKGFRYIERMLAAPGREFHVLDLVAVERGTLPAVSTIDDDSVNGAARGDGPLAVIDETARAAYRRRLLEVEDDIEEARRANDLARLELAERDRDFLVSELASAVGLGGRLRSTGATTERARVSVARCLRYALDQLSRHHPQVASHLGTSLHTGAYCSYRPDPLVAIVWET